MEIWRSSLRTCGKVGWVGGWVGGREEKKAVGMSSLGRRGGKEVGACVCKLY